MDADGLEVSHLGRLPLVYSRTGAARNILGLVTDDADRSAAGLIRTYDTRWAVEQVFKDSQQLLGMGYYQNRPSWAAVTHRSLECLAYALLNHLRLEHHGVQGQ